MSAIDDDLQTIETKTLGETRLYELDITAAGIIETARAP
jgi:hypothetical protein